MPQVRRGGGRAQALLAEDSEAVEVLFVPQAIQCEGWLCIRGLTPEPEHLADGPVDALQLPKWGIQLRDRPRYGNRTEERMVCSPAAPLGTEDCQARANGRDGNTCRDG